MDDARFMCGLQACGDLPGERHDFRHRQALIAQNARQIGALDVRHRDVLDAVDFSEVVNADDVLVRDLTGEEQLLLEAPLDVLRGGRIPRDFRPNDFEGDRDLELLVIGLIDRAHAADAELTQDVIPRSELLPGGERSEGRRRASASRGGETGGISGLLHRWRAAEHGFGGLLHRLPAEHGFGVVWLHKSPVPSDSDGI